MPPIFHPGSSAGCVSRPGFFPWLSWLYLTVFVFVCQASVQRNSWGSGWIGGHCSNKKKMPTIAVSSDYGSFVKFLSSFILPAPAFYSKLSFPLAPSLPSVVIEVEAHFSVTHFQLKEAGKIVIIRSTGLSCLRRQNLIHRNKTIKLDMFRIHLLISMYFKSNMGLLCSYEREIFINDILCQKSMDLYIWWWKV